MSYSIHLKLIGLAAVCHEQPQSTKGAGACCQSKPSVNATKGITSFGVKRTNKALS